MKISLYKLTTLLCLLICFVSANAQKFTLLPDKDFKVSKELPYFTASINLGKIPINESYTIRLIYPEYKELSYAESVFLKDKVLDSEPRLSQEVGVFRKMVVLDYSILPFIKKNNKYYRLISFSIDTLRNGINFNHYSVASRVKSFTSTLTDETTNKAHRYVSKSKLETGKWVKIKVSDEGIYQLTNEQLSSMGFNDITKVKLYGNGGLMQDSVLDFTSEKRVIDDLEEVPLYRRNNSVLFFAEGTRRLIRQTLQGKYGKLIKHLNNPYTSYSYYFLTEGNQPLEWKQAPAQSATLTNTTYNAVPYCSIIEKDEFSWYNGGRQFYDSYDFINGNSKTYTLNLPDYAEPDSNENIFVVMSSNSRSGVLFSFTLNNSLKGTYNMPVLSGSYTSAMERSFNIQGSPTANNTITIKTTSGQSARLNYIRVPYMRQLNANGTPFSFETYSYTSNVAKYVVNNANSNTRVWRIGRAGDPITEMSGELVNGSNYQVNLPLDQRRYVIADISRNYPAPVFVGNIANQNLHADSAFDMVIIIPSSGKLQEQAKRLADYHLQKTGLRVKIVRADQLYNEFGSGTPDATAYRRYMKMLYDKATTDKDMPKYLLLFGDCIWDNRMVTAGWKGKNPDDYLLAFESDYSLGELDCYVTDDYYGLLDDGEGINIEREKIDLGIGRLTATTAEDAKILVDKIIRYSENKTIGNWKNTICMMADDGDGNLHMSDAETVLKDISNLTADFKIKKIYWDAYKRTTTATGNSYPGVTKDIKDMMTNGALIMNYTGHGAPTQVSHEKALVTTDFLNKSERLPLWILASCELDPYDDPTYNNIGRTAVLNPDGGCISFICASRTVYSDRNNYLNCSLMKNLLMLANDGSAITMGEAMMKTKVSLVQSGLDRTDNRLKYALIGDPAVCLKYPTAKVLIDSIDGKANSNDKTTLKAGSVVKIVGHIESTNGEKLNEFNGTLNSVMFDKEQTIICKNNTNTASSPYKYNAWTKTLFDGTDSVKNGTFSINIPIPLDISYSTNVGRVLFYAANNNTSIEAHGTYENLILNGTSENFGKDSIGPKIYVYLDTPDFENKGHVSQTALFSAIISDESGINSTGNGIGHDLELCIDGKETETYNLNNYFTYNFGSYQSGNINYQLENLEEGNHQLTFRAWDLQNNSSTAVLDFIVIKSNKPRLKIYSSQNPAKSFTSFTISCNGFIGDIEETIEVTDVLGRTIWTNTSKVTAPSATAINWDLTTSSGVPVSKGIYFYRVVAKSNGEESSSETKKIIIVRQ